MRCQIREMKRALMFAMVILAGAYAKASNDILLIDVNNVVPEIQHIRSFLKSEQAQGRELDTKLVIVPSEKRIPMSVRQKIQNLFLQTIDPNTKYYQDHCSVSAMNSSPKLKENCERVILVSNAARDEASKLMNGTRKDGALTIDDIKLELAETLRGPYEFSRIFISGHHSPDGNRGFISGELFAEFTSDVAKDLLNDVQSTRSVRSFMMLGCWTGREDMMRKAWGQVIPTASLHSGFVEEAPAKINPTNLIVLDSILRNEQLIGESHSEDELRQRYSKLKVADRKVAVLVKDTYLAPTGLKRLK